MSISGLLWICWGSGLPVSSKNFPNTSLCDQNRGLHEMNSEKTWALPNGQLVWECRDVNSLYSSDTDGLRDSLGLSFICKMSGFNQVISKILSYSKILWFYVNICSLSILKFILQYFRYKTLEMVLKIKEMWGVSSIGKKPHLWQKGIDVWRAT